MATLGEWLRHQSSLDIDTIVDKIKKIPAVLEAVSAGASSVTISWEDFSTYTGFKNIKRLKELLATISKEHAIDIKHTVEEVNEWSHGAYYSHYIVINW